MNDHTAQPAWFFRFFAVVTALTLVIAGLTFFDFFTHLLAPDPASGSVIVRLVIGLVFVPAGLIISLLILRRTHRNVTGLFLLMYTFSLMTSTLRSDSPLQLLSIGFRPCFLGLWLLPLYFPDGEAYPVRFRRWIRLHSTLLTLSFLFNIFYTPTVSITGLQGQPIEAVNPLFIPALGPISNLAGMIQFILWMPSVLLIVPSVLLRYRASTGVVRQQIKWFVWSFTLLIVMFLMLLPQVAASPSGRIDLSKHGVFGIFITLFTILFFPVAPFVAVGVAILRHRLYDIDIIIRRTLVYSILTGILAAIYFGGVVVIQRIVQAATGQTSDAGIVISTLLIAALFAPIRRRVQDTIGRRFYRRKYDAEKTLAKFNQSLRDEVDIETLKDSLVNVVQETMQPTRVSLWVKDATGDAPKEIRL